MFFLQNTFYKRFHSSLRPDGLRMAIGTFLNVVLKKERSDNYYTSSPLQISIIVAKVQLLFHNAKELTENVSRLNYITFASVPG